MIIDNVKIRRKLKVHEIWLDIHFTTKNIIGLKIRNQDCRKCVMWLWCLSWFEESRGSEHNRRVLSKALHLSSFPCCHPQDPVLPSLFALCARMCALPLVFVCPRKLLKERELQIKGWQDPFACSLFLIFHTAPALGCKLSQKVAWTYSRQIKIGENPVFLKYSSSPNG